MKRATFYLVLEPRHDFAGRLLDIKPDRITTTSPQRLGARHVAIKINVDVDEALFQQYLPEATIVVNDRRALIAPTVSVDVTDEPEAEPEAVAE